MAHNAPRGGGRGPSPPHHTVGTPSQNPRSKGGDPTWTRRGEPRSQPRADTLLVPASPPLFVFGHQRRLGDESRFSARPRLGLVRSNQSKVAVGGKCVVATTLPNGSLGPWIVSRGAFGGRLRRGRRSENVPDAPVSGVALKRMASGTASPCGLSKTLWPLRLEYVVNTVHIHAMSRDGWPGGPVAGGSCPAVVLAFKYLV